MKDLEEFFRGMFKVCVWLKLFDIGVILLGWLVVLWFFAKLVKQIEWVFGL